MLLLLYPFADKTGGCWIGWAKHGAAHLWERQYLGKTLVLALEVSKSGLDGA